MIPDTNDSDTEEIIHTRKKKTSYILSDDEEEEIGDLEEPLSEGREQQKKICDEKSFNETLLHDDRDSSDSVNITQWKPLRRVRVTVADDDEEEKSDDTYTEKLLLPNNFKPRNTKYNLKPSKIENGTTDLINNLEDVYKGLTSDDDTEENKFLFHESNKRNDVPVQDYASVQTKEFNESLARENDQKNSDENIDDDNDSFTKQNKTIEALRDSDESQAEEDYTKSHHLKKSKNSIKTKKCHRTLKEIKARKDEMLQIRSESQRHLRESTIKLPYYRPQRMTLTEFLERKERNKISLQNRPPRPLELLELEEPNSRNVEAKMLFPNICDENSLSESTKNLKESSKQNVNNKEVEMDCVAEVLQDAIEQGQTPYSEILITDNPAIENNSADKNSETSLINIKTEDKTTAGLDLSQIKAKLKQMYGSYVPRLSGTPNSIIDFSEEQPMKKEVKHFIEKFVKHKEKTQKSTQELNNSKKQKKLAFELKIESESIPQAPGARLLHIKEQLKEKMEERKEAIRKKRMEAFKLENEEGFDGNVDGIDSEAELTDQTDTDEEEITDDDDDDAVDSEEEEELEFGHLRPQKKKKKSMFIDEEAEEDDADDEIDDDDDYDLPPFHLQISPRKDDNSESINNTENSKGQLLSWLDGKKDLKASDNINLPTITALSAEKKHLENEDHEQNLTLPVDLEHEEENLLPTSKTSNIPHPSSEDTNTNFENLQEDGKHTLFCEENSPLLGLKSTQPLSASLEDSNANFGKSQENDEDSPNTNKKADNFLNGDSSFELGRSIIPGYQPGGGLKYGGHAESGSEDEEWFVSSAFKSQNMRSIEDTETHGENNLCTASMIGGLHLKFEGSPSSSAIKSDNFLKSELSELGNLINTSMAEKSRQDIPCALQDVIDSSFSQKTDMIALCSGTFDNIADGASQLKLESTQENSANMNELLDLCSGKFNERMAEKSRQDTIPCGLQDIINDSSFSQKTDVIALCSGTFDNISDGASQLKLETTQADSANMNELLDLCSGKFNESQSLPTEQDYYSDASVEIGHKKSQKRSHHLIEDSDSEMDEKLRLSDSEDELENSELQQEKKSTTSKFESFRGVGGIRKEFVDEEAELSGSGVSEDENEDDDDQLENEVDIFSDVDISDEELRNQIERVHNKAILDEEKRELLLLQERYLMDGDLHSDGQGRQRKFRWRNIDENMDLDNGNISSDEEEKENEIEEWRLQRFEREKWLHEQEENRKSDLVSPKEDTTGNNAAPIDNSKIGSFFHRNSSVKKLSGKLSIKNHSGSFLAKGDAFLDRLAMNIKKEDEAVGRRCTKNIIFKASSSEKVQQAKKIENNLTPLSQNLSQNKKPKLNVRNNSEISQNRRRSIFDYFDTK